MDLRVGRGQHFFWSRALRPAASVPFLGSVVAVPRIVLVLGAIAALAVFLPRLLRGELAALRRETAEELDRRNADVDRRLSEMTQTVDRRLDTAGKTSTQIHEKLGEVTKATSDLNDRAKELGRRGPALRP